MVKILFALCLNTQSWWHKRESQAIIGNHECANPLCHQVDVGCISLNGLLVAQQDIRRLPNSLGFVLLASWTSVPNFMGKVVDRLTNISMASTSMSLAWLWRAFVATD